MSLLIVDDIMLEISKMIDIITYVHIRSTCKWYRRTLFPKHKYDEDIMDRVEIYKGVNLKKKTVLSVMDRQNIAHMIYLHPRDHTVYKIYTNVHCAEKYRVSLAIPIIKGRSRDVFEYFLSTFKDPLGLPGRKRALNHKNKSFPNSVFSYKFLHSDDYEWLLDNEAFVNMMCASDFKAAAPRINIYAHKPQEEFRDLPVVRSVILRKLSYHLSTMELCKIYLNSVEEEDEIYSV